ERPLLGWERRCGSRRRRREGDEEEAEDEEAARHLLILASGYLRAAEMATRRRASAPASRTSGAPGCRSPPRARADGRNRVEWRADTRGAADRGAPHSRG